MAIRCTSKAIIVKNGCVLLNRCRHLNGGVYYDLPGGGQRTSETMEEALVREIREETGYEVCSVRFAGLAEEIYTDPLICRHHPEYAHRLLHIFIAQFKSEHRTSPTEKDLCMEECVWVPLETAEKLNINPEGIASNLRKILENNEVIYLGSRMIVDFK